MSVAQTYIMTAAEGKETAMEAALTTLAEAVRPIEGCEGVVVLRDQKNKRRFIFIETFVDADAHRASAALLPKEAMAPLMATIEGKPDGSTYSYVKTL